MGLSILEWLEAARAAVESLSADVDSVKSLLGKWRIIKSRLDRLKSQLEDLSRKPPSLLESTTSSELLYEEILAAIVESCHNAQLLAEECRSPDGIVAVGKLLMQSKLDSSAGRLQQHICDCELLLKNRESLGVARNLAIALQNHHQATAKAGINRELLRSSVRDLITRLQVASSRPQALDSIVELMEQDESNVPLVAAQGGIRALVQLLDAAIQAAAREKAASAIRSLAKAGMYEAELVAEGAVAPLARLLASGSPAAREAAAAALEELSYTPESARALASCGGAAALAALATSGAGTPAARAAAAGCLRNLASAGQIPAEDEPEVVAALVSLLSFGTPAARVAAVAAIHSLSSTDTSLLSRYGGRGAEAMLRFVEFAPPGKPREMAMAVLAATTVAATTCTASSNASPPVASSSKARNSKVIAARKRVSLVSALATLARRSSSNQKRSVFTSWLKRFSFHTTTNSTNSSGGGNSGHSGGSKLKSSVFFFSKGR